MIAILLSVLGLWTVQVSIIEVNAYNSGTLSPYIDLIVTFFFILPYVIIIHP